jgi:hypothetical protein
MLRALASALPASPITAALTAFSGSAGEHSSMNR